jgi:Zn-dependent protease
MGPFINVSLAALFYLITIATTGGVSRIFGFIAFINAFLAFFNLLPFGPLDGMKIFNWRKEIWISLIACSLLLLYLVYPFVYQ